MKSKKKSVVQEYKEYSSKIGDRKNLYKLVAEKYHIQSAIYPGSHIDIGPSLVIPSVTYIDNFTGAISFFNHMDEIVEYIEENKEYDNPSQVDFIGADYSEELAIDKVDLVISQYAGFVGQSTKRYLKVGGILLCNDSHGDATLARFDDDFEFIGVVDGDSKIDGSDLDKYFKFKRERAVDLDQVRQKMKGPKYALTASNYLFRKK